MSRTRCSLIIGCQLLLAPLTFAEDNSLLVQANDRCMLDTVPEQLPQALKACQEAAREGDAAAQFELGRFHYKGQGTARDLAQALYWFEQASLQGNAEAQYYLGGMFIRGEGVPKNPLQAYILLKMAAVNGSDDAMDAADQLATGMPEEQIQLANQVLGEIVREYLQDLQNQPQEIPLLLKPMP